MKKQYMILSLIALSLLIIPSVYSKQEDNPFNQLWDTLNNLAGRVSTIEAQDFQTQINDLETRITSLEDDNEALEIRVSLLETIGPGGFSDPDFDSGWISLVVWPGFTEVDHNLGTDDLFVYIIGASGDPDAGNVHFHQTGFGGDQYNPGASTAHSGLSWTINTATGSGKTINLLRWSDDYSWNYGRVLIWKLSPP